MKMASILFDFLACSLFVLVACRTFFFHPPDIMSTHALVAACFLLILAGRFQSQEEWKMSGLFDLLNQDQREHGFKHTQDEILFWLSFCRTSEAHSFSKDVKEFVELMLHSEQDRKDRIAQL